MNYNPYLHWNVENNYWFVEKGAPITVCDHANILPNNGYQSWHATHTNYDNTFFDKDVYLQDDKYITFMKRDDKGKMWWMKIEKIV